MYGYFRCPDCNAHWESAHTYTKGRNSTQYYQQECKKCRIMCSPYRVEPTKCSICGKEARTCLCDKAHKSDPNKPHRSDLCEKCRSGRPCVFN